MFSSQQSRAPSFSSTTLHPQAAGSSSLPRATPRPTGPRGINHSQSEPVFGQPRWLLNRQQQQQPRSRVQHWQSRQRPGQMWPNTTPQSLRPYPSQTATTVRNIYRGAGSTTAQSVNTNTAMRGIRSGGPAVRPPTSTLLPRPVEKTREIRSQLLDVFPDSVEQVDLVLRQNQCIYSVDELCLRVSEMV